MVRTKFLSLLAAACLLTIGHAMADTVTPNTKELRICTGGESGNYYFAGNELAKRMSKGFEHITIITTGGSLDNVHKLMNNDCDIAFSQSDVLDNYKIDDPASTNKLQTLDTLYSEYAQLVCPTNANFSRIVDIGKKKPPAKMLVGAEGSGTAETWRALRQADKSLYESLERIPTSGIEAVKAVANSRDGQPSCMLWVSGMGSGDIRAANAISVNNAKHTPSLTLIDLNDRDMMGLKDSTGQPKYRFERITRATKGYENIMQDRYVTVPVVDAQLVVRSDYWASMGSKKDRFLMAIEDAKPTILNKVNPQD